MPGLTPLRTVAVTRYVTPLREGGSMPAIAEADDNFLYALKFRGAGQGTRTLIAELIGGEIARVLDLRIPELVFATLDENFGRTEPDEEIQDLLKASVGLNLGLHYLSGSITFDPAATKVDATTASRIVWLDMLLNNVDRTVRNTNLLWWNREIWLIDHGASLYFHHSWTDWEAQATRAFPLIKNHVLLNAASEMEAANTHAKERITPAIIEAIVSQIPDVWLENESPFDSNDAHRAAYARFLNLRLAYADAFTEEVKNAR